MIQHFRMFAGYNAWANERVYQAVAGLTDDDYRADRGAFFGSVHRTLNHIMVADLIWMKRLTGHGDAPGKLDEVLYDDPAALHEVRTALDARISDWIFSLDDAALNAMVEYRAITRPDPFRQSVATVLAHLFNHQTHHRGQVHTLLTILQGNDAGPALDLVAYQRQIGTTSF